MKRTKQLSLIALFLVALFLGFSYIPNIFSQKKTFAAGTPTIVQTCTGGNYGSTATCTLPSTLSANTTLVATGYSSGSGETLSISGCGLTWTKVFSDTASADFTWDVWTAPSTAGTSCTASQTIGGSQYNFINIAEVSGVNGLDAIPVDEHSPFCQTGCRSGSLTTNTNGDLVLFVGFLPSYSLTYSTFSNSYSIYQQNFFNSGGGSTSTNATAYILQGTAGNTSTTYNLSGATSYADSILIPFKSSGSGTPAIPPSAPTNLAVTTSTPTTVSLSWTASSAGTYSVAGYDIYQGSNQVGITSSTTYTVTGLSPSTGYTFSVYAYDSQSNSSPQSNSVNATTQAPIVDTTPPSVPTNLSANAISSSQINLSWTASTDNVGVTGYDIYRGGVQIGTSATNGYSDSGLAASTQYTYTVSAYDASGNNSAQSTSASATTQAKSSGGGTGPWSGVLTPSRAINWGNAGLPSTLIYGTGGSACNGSSANCTETVANPWTPPTRTQCGSTISPSGSAATNTSNINNALAACNPGTYVLLGPGTFTVNSSINFYTQNGVTLRGSGPQSTSITLTNAADVQMGAGYSYGLCGWTGGYAAGATSITLSNCSSAPHVGVLTTLAQCNTGFTGCGYANISGSNVSLYTAAPGSLFLNSWAGTQTMYFGSGTTWPGYPITAVQNGTSLTVSGGTPPSTFFYIGTPADNNGIFICGGVDGTCQRTDEGSEPTDLQQQIVMITSVSGSGPSYTATISPGLYMPNWNTSNNPSANWSTGAHTVTALGNGIEDMTIYNAYDGANESVQFNNSYGSWVKGVRLLGSGTYYPLVISGSKNSLVSNNYIFSDPFGDGQYPGAMQEQQDSDDLVLNNIMVSGTSWVGFGLMSGDVAAYNYGRDTFTSYPLDMFEHVPGDVYQLYEGNEVGTLQEDATHGTHDLNTAFRNYVPGYDVPYVAQGNPAGITWNPWDRFTNTVGNVIGNSAGLLNTYQSETQAAGGYIFSIGYGGGDSDPLALTTSMRWGNWDSVTNAVRWCGNSSDPGWSTICGSKSEVPSNLASPNAALSNPVPSTTSLPPSFFLPTIATPDGGTGLNWWKVCTGWTSFPTNCATTQTQPFPAIGPDVTGGPYSGGHAYDIPAALAWENLPVDPTYQSSYSITGSSWSGGTETLTISNPPNLEHLMGAFQLSGVSSACTAGATFNANNELLMTGSSATSISYALVSNPGSCSSGTFKFPDVREFNEAVYENDPASGGGDTTPPTISVSSPANNATVSSTITLSGTAADNVAVASVAVSVDGGAYQSAVGTTSWTYSLNTTSLSNGTHTIIARATDTSGNTGISSTVTITVNNASGPSAPSITSSLTANATTTTSFSYQITGSNSPTSYNATGLPSGLSVSTSSGLISGTPTVAGTSNITISATNAGGTGTATLVLTVRTIPDTTPPTTSITSPVNNATVSSTISVFATASDNVGVSYVDLLVDNTVVATDTTSPYTFSLNTTSFANGSHVMFTKAYDAAGNVGSSATISVTVSNPAETLTTSLTASNASSVAPLTTSLTASAAGTAQGTVNYIFYCNRTDTGTNITSPADLTVNAVTSTSYLATNLCTYETAGSYTAKVIVERGSAPPAQAQEAITVSAAPSSGGGGGGSSGGGGGGGGSSGGGGGGSSSPLFTVHTMVTTSTPTSAKITVMTSLPALTQLFYGTSPSYGSTTLTSPLLTTSYFNLENLIPGKTYYVKAVSLAEGETESANITFTPGTMAPIVTTPPPSASSASLPPFIRNLTIGSTGSDVLELQQLLNQWGYTISPSGPGSPGHESSYFGSLTTKAVQKFQAAEGISPVSGFVGPLTRAKLNSLINAGGTQTTTPPSPSSGSLTENLAPGSSGPQVDTLQSILVTDGYLAPQYVTGYYGSLTEQAVEAFQTKEGIVSYGTPSTTGYGAVGPKTRGELDGM